MEKKIHLTVDKIAKKLLLDRHFCSNCLWDYVREGGVPPRQLICGKTMRLKPIPQTCDKWEIRPKLHRSTNRKI
jgi:rubredoxin